MATVTPLPMMTIPVLLLKINYLSKSKAAWKLKTKNKIVIVKSNISLYLKPPPKRKEK